MTKSLQLHNGASGKMAQNKFVGLTFTKKRRIDPALKRAF
jgi:hypothetical protein